MNIVSERSLPQKGDTSSSHADPAKEDGYRPDLGQFIPPEDVLQARATAAGLAQLDRD
jgi:hypothetical protein